MDDRHPVLGIDPGLNRTGYAVIERDGRGGRLIEGGVIRTDRERSLPDRLVEIGESLREVIREYDPGLGKFISVDPIQDLGNPQQWNAYTYATNNPITFSDPSGLIARENAEGGAPTPATGGGNDVGGNSSTTAGTGEPRRQETTATSSHAKNP